MNTERVPENVVREVSALTADLFREDDLGVVLRVHLRIENVLNRFLNAMAPFPDYLDGASLRYYQKVRLALALGLVPEAEPSLRAFGKLRNDFAHQPDMQLDKQAISRLYNGLGSVDKALVANTFESMRGEYEQLRQANQFVDLSPGDQFKVITVAVWTSVRTALEQARRLGPLHATTPV